ncbi:helix-turn-helix transcriptional regulator [Ideonella sp.]|uniref:helix-turn-helix transcriptional regulator n=1 Tax=Ideonella sp. TaxID=1929293 RepID=UPI0035B2B6AC
MLLVALTCLRVLPADADVAGAASSGDVQDALRMGTARLDRMSDIDTPRRAVLGQLMGQLLLATGREEQAEELFQKQLRVYEGMSRPQMRWLSSMDRAYLQLHLNRAGPAAECFNVVADCDEAPAPLRVEALAGLALAVHGLGEHRRAARTLAFAMNLASAQAADMKPLLEAAELELKVTARLRQYGDAAAAWMDVPPAPATLLDKARTLAQTPILSQRLVFLAALCEPGLGAPGGAAGVFDALRWWRDRRLAPVEELGRIEAALALVEQGDAHTAGDVLGALASDDTRMLRHRHAIELAFVVSRLHALQGRYMDALRCFRQHASQALTRMRTELQRVPYSRFLELQERADQTDSDQLRLPLRYRRAYQFIVEHLNEKTLSVRRIAAHIDVTERALQMAFRTHLGLTPAELIRRLRMARIRTELQHLAGRDSVLAVANRWGMGNRSTLAQNYRQHYGEAPTATSGFVDLLCVEGEMDLPQLAAIQA